jgi:hypothetical protein
MRSPCPILVSIHTANARPAAPTLEDFAFTHTTRVRWSEVDATAIVFTANYLVYFDIAMTEFLRATTNLKLSADLFLVRSSIDYHRPARFDEELTLAPASSASAGPASTSSSPRSAGPTSSSTAPTSTSTRPASRPRRPSCPPTSSPASASPSPSWSPSPEPAA